MNFVSRLCDDDLQVQIGHARHGNGLRSGAVRIHEVDAGPGPPTGSEVAVRRDRINLRLAPFSVKGFWCAGCCHASFSAAVGQLLAHKRLMFGMDTC